MPRFTCPICGSVNWREVVVPKGEGRYKTDFAECCGCSAMFHRPELFTVGRGKASQSSAAVDHGGGSAGCKNALSELKDERRGD